MRYAYPLLVVIGGFAKAYIVNKIYGPEILKLFVLYTSIIIVIVEFENIKADTLRQICDENITIGKLSSLASIFLCVFSISYLYTKNDSNSIAVAISSITVIESLEQSYVRHYKSIKKTYGLLLRLINIGFLYYDLLIASLIFTCISTVRLNLLFTSAVRLNFSAGEFTYLCISLIGRLRDVAQNYILVNLVSDNIFFGFYIYLRIVQNTVGIIYSYLRSDHTIKFDFLKSVVLKADSAVILLSICALFLNNLYLSIILFPLVLAFENLAVQFFVFGGAYKQSVHLAVNITALVGSALAILSLIFFGQMPVIILSLYIIIVVANIYYVINNVS